MIKITKKDIKKFNFEMSLRKFRLVNFIEASNKLKKTNFRGYNNVKYIVILI